MVEPTAHNRKDISSNLILLKIYNKIIRIIRISVIGMHMRLIISKRLFKSIIRIKGNNLIGKILISKINFKGSNPFFPVRENENL